MTQPPCDIQPERSGNSYVSAGASKSTFFEYLRMRLRENSFPKVDTSEAQSIVQKADLALINSPSDQPRATWIGHATVLVQYRNINFLTDPHLTTWAGPVDYAAPPRFTAPALDFATLPRIDFVVISHNHYDHLDHRTVDKLGSSVTWFVPMGLKAWFVGRGIEPAKVIELNWWQSHTYNAEVTVTLAPAVHWSKRTPWDTNQSLWGTWSIQISGFKCWFGGDTAFDEKIFSAIGKCLGPFDLALIPIGAYSPRYFMGAQHLDPAQAVIVHQLLLAKYSLPIHWGTFQLTHEPFLEPPQLLKKAVAAVGIDPAVFKPVKIGGTVLLD